MEQLNRSINHSATMVERIIQIGTGVFLRGFADWIIDKMNKCAGFDTGVVVCQSTSGKTAETFKKQDGLFTVRLTGIVDGKPETSHDLVSCVTRALSIPDDFDAFLALADNPDLRFIISNTTEAGISFDKTDPYEKPLTFPGRLARLLYRRFRNLPDNGFIIIPCELIEDNGNELKKAVLNYATLWGLKDGFDAWLGRKCIFCGTLVDRIVAGFPKEKAESIFAELGYRDELLVEGEFFHLWVIEAPEEVRTEFPAEKAGLNVIFTDDIRPYRERKVRILNGTHTAMLPVSYLMGIDTVREALENPLINRFVKETVFNEIVPAVKAPGAKEFADEVLNRFMNPFIVHRFSSIMLNSFPKWRARLLPTVIDYHHLTGMIPERIAFSFAALLVFYRGIRENGTIPLNDNPEVIETMKTLWQDSTDTGKITRNILSRKDFWGADLNDIPQFSVMVAVFMKEIVENGMAQALSDFMN
ncbi:MAG TPA: tagaturonate reductase [Desulfomonilia bacterium]